MDRRLIEDRAWDLLADMYRAKEELFPMGVPSPMHMLEPEHAARFLGYEVEYAQSLGRWSKGDANFEVAGLLDQQRKLIRVSTAAKFPYETQRFTLAHEIGHIVLEHPGHRIHRDRPAFNIESRSPREPYEQEADYFAACVLAPRRLVTEAYRKRFGIGPPLPLTDDVAFNLCAESAHALMRAGPESMKFPATVASTTHFNGRHFPSLASEFKLSVGAMAIRVREVGLVED